MHQYNQDLHLGSVYNKRQCCDNASNTVLIENNRVALDWGCNPFLSASIVFNENSNCSVITVLTLAFGVNRSLGGHLPFTVKKLLNTNLLTVKSPVTEIFK